MYIFLNGLFFPLNNLNFGERAIQLPESQSPDPFRLAASSRKLPAKQLFSKQPDCFQDSPAVLNPPLPLWGILHSSARAIAKKARIPAPEGLSPVITATDNLHLPWKTLFQDKLRWTLDDPNSPCSYSHSDQGWVLPPGGSIESLWLILR
jgi:hypothetical protein